MRAYPVQSRKLAGTDYREVSTRARAIYTELKKRSKRRTYIRSAFFSKGKIFLDLYWQHLHDQRNWRDRMRRLRFYACAIELIEHSRYESVSKTNQNNPTEILHRFTGITHDHEIFHVQVKEDKRKDQKFLISIFPGN